MFTSLAIKLTAQTLAAFTARIIVVKVLLERRLRGQKDETSNRS